VLSAKEALRIAKESQPLRDKEFLYSILNEIENAARLRAATDLQISRNVATPNVRISLANLGYTIVGSAFDDYLTIYWEDV
jgi:hypothetical protein